MSNLFTTVLLVSNPVRSRMTMRATVQRDTASGPDGFGLPNAASWTAHIASLACWVFTKVEREVIDGDKTAILAVHKMLVPLGTDIIEHDRVTAIKDRLAADIIANTMRIHAVIRRATHLECLLEEVA